MSNDAPNFQNLFPPSHPSPSFPLLGWVWVCHHLCWLADANASEHYWIRLLVVFEMTWFNVKIVQYGILEYDCSHLIICTFRATQTCICKYMLDMIHYYTCFINILMTFRAVVNAKEELHIFNVYWNAMDDIRIKKLRLPTRTHLQSFPDVHSNCKKS